LGRTPCISMGIGRDSRDLSTCLQAPSPLLRVPRAALKMTGAERIHLRGPKGPLFHREARTSRHPAFLAGCLFTLLVPRRGCTEALPCGCHDSGPSFSASPLIQDDVCCAAILRGAAPLARRGCTGALSKLQSVISKGRLFHQTCVGETTHFSWEEFVIIKK
jgi:hypothetical protein